MNEVLNLIHELATFELEADAVIVTEADLIRDGFGENPLFFCFVAELNQKIIGMALYYYRYSTWKGKTIHLEDLIVKKEFRGIGAGGGNFFVASTREVKKNIEPFSKSALDIINSTDIVSFEFEQGGLEGEIHIGFIAEDTPEELATSAHDQIVIPSSLGILMKALQELDKKLQILENNA